KATGAVGGFHHARRETGLPYGRRLLVARHAADRNLAPEEVGSGHAEVRGAVAHLGQERLRYFQDLEYVAVPFPLSDVVDQRARRVRGVGGVHPATGELPDQEAVDRAEEKLTRLCPCPRALHVVEKPGKLRAREIGIEEEPGALRDHLL